MPCPVAALRAQELSTDALAGNALAGSLPAGVRLAEGRGTQRTAQCARPAFHPAAAAQTNPRLGSVGVLHGLCGDACANALVYQRL
ncbi:TPA: hypothetical protein ACH3X3_008202 [Trebouxia sp. C0006]